MGTKGRCVHLALKVLGIKGISGAMSVGSYGYGGLQASVLELRCIDFQLMRYGH
jgi:hypothetical protein